MRTLAENMETLNRGLDKPYYANDLLLEADFYDDCVMEKHINSMHIPTKEYLIFLFRGKSYNEIAKIFGVPHTTVSRRISNFCAYLDEEEWFM